VEREVMMRRVAWRLCGKRGVCGNCGWALLRLVHTGHAGPRQGARGGEQRRRQAKPLPRDSLARIAFLGRS